MTRVSNFYSLFGVLALYTTYVQSVPVVTITPAYPDTASTVDFHITESHSVLSDSYVAVSAEFQQGSLFLYNFGSDSIVDDSRKYINTACTATIQQSGHSAVFALPLDASVKNKPQFIFDAAQALDAGAAPTDTYDLKVSCANMRTGRYGSTWDDQQLELHLVSNSGSNKVYTAPGIQSTPNATPFPDTCSAKRTYTSTTSQCTKKPMIDFAIPPRTRAITAEMKHMSSVYNMDVIETQYPNSLTKIRAKFPLYRPIREYERIDMKFNIPVTHNVGGNTKCEVKYADGTPIDTDTIVKESTLAVVFKAVVHAYTESEITQYGWKQVLQNTQPQSVKASVLTITCEYVQIDATQPPSPVYVTLTQRGLSGASHSIGTAKAANLVAPTSTTIGQLDGFTVTRFLNVGTGIINSDMSITNISENETTRTPLSITFTLSPFGFFPEPGQRLVIMIPSHYHTIDNYNRPTCLGPQITYAAHLLDATAELKALVITLPSWSIKLNSGGTITCSGFEARATTAASVVAIPPTPIFSVPVTPPHVMLLNIDHGIVRATITSSPMFSLLPNTQIYNPATYASVLMHNASSTLTQTWVYLPSKASFAFTYTLNFTNPSPLHCYHENNLVPLQHSGTANTLTFSNATALANTDGVVLYCVSELQHTAVALDGAPIVLTKIKDTGFKAKYNGKAFPSTPMSFEVTLPESATFLPSSGSINILLNMPWRASEQQCKLYAGENIIPSSLSVSSNLIRIDYSTSLQLLALSHELNPFHYHDNGQKLDSSPAYFDLATLKCTHLAPRQTGPLTGMVVLHNKHNVLLKGSITLVNTDASIITPILATSVQDSQIACSSCIQGTTEPDFALTTAVPVLVEKGDIQLIDMPPHHYSAFDTCVQHIEEKEYPASMYTSTTFIVANIDSQRIPATTLSIDVNGTTVTVPLTTWKITCVAAKVPSFSSPIKPDLNITILDVTSHIVYSSSSPITSTEQPLTHTSQAWVFVDNTLAIHSSQPLLLQTSLVPILSMSYTFESPLTYTSVTCYTNVGPVQAMDINGATLTVQISNIYSSISLVDVTCLGLSSPTSTSMTVQIKTCTSATTCAVFSNGAGVVGVGTRISATSATINTDKTYTTTDVVVKVPRNDMPFVAAIDLTLPLGYTIEAPMTPISTPSALVLNTNRKVTTMDTTHTSAGTSYQVSGISCQPSTSVYVTAFEKSGRWVLRWPIDSLPSNDEYRCDRILSPAVSTSFPGEGTVELYMYDPALTYSRPALSYDYNTPPFMPADYQASALQTSVATSNQQIDQYTILTLKTKIPSKVEPNDQIIISMAPGYVATTNRTTCLVQLVDYTSEQVGWLNLTTSNVVSNNAVISITMDTVINPQTDIQVICEYVENPYYITDSSIIANFEVAHPSGRKFRIVDIMYPATTGGLELPNLSSKMIYNPQSLASSTQINIPQLHVRLPQDGRITLGFSVDMNTTSTTTCLLSLDSLVVASTISEITPQNITLTVPSGIARDVSLVVTCNALLYLIEGESATSETPSELYIATLSATGSLLTGNNTTPVITTEDVPLQDGDTASRVISRIFLDRKNYLYADEMQMYEKQYEAHLSRPGEPERTLTAIVAIVEPVDSSKMPHWTGRMNVTLLVSSDTLSHTELLTRVNELADDIVSRKIMAHRVLGITRGMISPFRVDCFNKVKDLEETDVNCGGTECPQCRDHKACGLQTDCTSHVCVYGQCNPSLGPVAENAVGLTFLGSLAQVVVAIAILVPSILYVVGVNR